MIHRGLFANLVLCWAVAWLFPAPLAAQTQTDSEITRSLTQAIEWDYRLRSFEIDVSSSRGTVTLKGTVKSFLDKDEVERIAKRALGVTSVVNLLDVDAAGVDDKRIADDIRGRLERSVFLRTADIRVQVDDGLVMLSGRPENWEQCRQAEHVASEVLGVRRVENRLAPSDMSSPKDQTDVLSSVEAALSRDGYLAGYPIDVTAESGTIRLAGEIPNLFHKERAEEQVRAVPGVRSVINELVVSSQSILMASSVPPTDQELQQWVYDELLADPRVDVDNLKIVASRGVVSMLGWVDSAFAKQTAERVATRVYGVARVQNQLEVRPVHRADEEIRQDLISNFNRDAMLAGQKISVAVHQGSAILSGEVPENAVKVHALRLASRVVGVRHITNQLIVSSPETVTDQSIQKHITQRINANVITRNSADQIIVKVYGGKVVISGTVNRSAEAIEVLRIANAAFGVESVENQLENASDVE